MVPNGSKTDVSSNKRKLSTILFEVGVLFHSVIIGIGLGVTTGTSFKTLLAAITLGTIESPRNVLMMDFVFAVATPVGVVIDILIRSSYSSMSVTGLWVHSMLNCIAAESWCTRVSSSC
uniref:Uncharacterized protein n=1 Tax=Globisporangium ultimum (strain ATCC 200006 / CBS 805.95 / DAOM BR144) TaxID=431595 RepID=K3WVH5_GLOUD